MSSQITELLHSWNESSPEALEALLPLVYDQLRALALRQVLREYNRMPIEPNELVHEVYLRLAASKNPFFRDRSHFYGVAVTLMRRILVDLSRRRNACKRGATAVHVELDEGIAAVGERLDFEVLDGALDRLALQDSQQARVVELRFFGGLSIQETAAQLGISDRTVKRDWMVAKTWLMRELCG